MSHTAKIVQAMQFNQEYDAATLASVTRIDEKSTQQILHLLSKNGVIDEVRKDRFRKNRTYKTKQITLFN